MHHRLPAEATIFFFFAESDAGSVTDLEFTADV
jgi:hypothetical protein